MASAVAEMAELLMTAPEGGEDWLLTGIANAHLGPFISEAGPRRSLQPLVEPGNPQPPRLDMGEPKVDAVANALSASEEMVGHGPPHGTLAVEGVHTKVTRI